MGLTPLAWLFLLGGFVAAAVLALAFATSGKRILLLLALDPFVVVGLYLFFHAAGAYEPEPHCTDCGEVAFFAGVVLIVNGIGWALGVAVGALLRRALGKAGALFATETPVFPPSWTAAFRSRRQDTRQTR
jgi:hypothetical protein